MRRLAVFFSALCLAALGLGLWLLRAPPAPAPVSVPPVAGWHWPRLPEVLRPPARPPVPIASPVERILIEKAARRMTVWQRAGAPKTYRIALGFTPGGDKSREGDGRTPEGIFRIDRLNRASAYHLSLGLDYPQPRHVKAARRAGVDPGGDIMIHGQPNQIAEGFRVKGDWTAGCIAITNAEIEEIFAHAAIGTRVEIRP